MTRQELKTKIETDQFWLEKAIVALDNSSDFKEQYKKQGQYIAAYLKSGKKLSGEKWINGAKEIALAHVEELLNISCENLKNKINNLKLELDKAERQLTIIENELTKEQEVDTTWMKFHEQGIY